MNTNQFNNDLDQCAASGGELDPQGLKLKTFARRRVRLALCAAALFGVVFVLPAGATTILVTSNSGYIANVDTTTGATSNAFQPGDGYKKWFDIAENDAGAIYTVGISSRYPANYNTALYSIDPAGPSATRIGVTGPEVNGLAFGPGGTLFGTGGGSLYSIDTGTGVATAVGSGSGGVGGSFVGSGDLTYAGGNSFFATSSNACGGSGDCLWKIDKTTGIGTPIGATHYNKIFGLAEIGNTLYGLDLNNHVLSIDQMTGLATRIASHSLIPISGFTYGAAVPPSAVTSPTMVVSEPPTMPLLLGGLALVGFGLLLRRRTARGRVDSTSNCTAARSVIFPASTAAHCRQSGRPPISRRAISIPSAARAGAFLVVTVTQAVPGAA